VSSLAIAADSKTLLVGLLDGSAKVFDLSAPDPAKAERQAIAAQGGAITSVAIGLDNATLLLGSEDKTVKAWQLVSPGPLKNFAGHGSQVYSVAWSPDASKALTGSADASARLWDVAKGPRSRRWKRPTQTWSTPSPGARKATFSPPAEMTSSSSSGSPPRGKSCAKGKATAVRSTPWHSAPMAPSSPQARSTRPSVCGTSPMARRSKKLEGHPDDVYGLAFSPDGKRIASIGYAGNLLTWEVETGKNLSKQKVAPGMMGYGPR